MKFAPVKPLRPAWQTALAAMICALAIAGSGVWVFGHDGLDEFPWRMWLLFGIGFSMAISGAVWAASQWMSPSGRSNFWRPALGLLIAIAGLWLGAATGPFEMWPAAICFSIGSIASLATGFGLVVVFRRSSPLMWNRVALAIGVAAGFSGFLVIQVHCPINDFGHMMLGHAVLPVLWGLVGYTLARISARLLPS